ncbi:MAG: Coenzyme F420 hydrogenase/dehydrogenase, beta subunit C-terminal domain [Lachnospiraceae bacterium]
MIKVIRKEMCMGCGACVFTCPRQCIVMQEDEEGFLYPEVNQENCMQCGLCEKICPIENKRNYVSNPVVEAYAGKNKTEKIRMQSSSGGIFTLLAEEIIAEGGTVYGAAFGEDAMVSHRKAEKPEELKGLRGSKYLQSNMGKIYPEIREKLSQGERVLFTGTPCQVAGLQSYLKKSYENLYCMDIICHGVPSPKVWKKYLEALEKRLGESLSGELNPSFRAKHEGWIRYSVSIPFSHDTEYRETLDQNLYMQTFLKNISLRPSCYQCQFKPSTRISDITLADFWGIQEVCPKLFDDKGTSLIIVNSSKGQNLFTKVREKMEAVKVDYEQAILHNASAIKSVEVPPERKSFFKNLNQGNIEKRMRRVIRGGIIRRMSMRKIILWIRKKIRTIYNDR